MTKGVLILTLLTAVWPAAAAADAEPILDRLTIVAPAAPGGGWDQTARTMQHVLQAEQIVRIVEVENIPGAAGTIGLADFISNRAGRGDAVLITGLVMLAAIDWNESQVSLSSATPIARLTGEYEAIAVPAGSPYHTMRELAAALRVKRGAVSWGGGSAGGTDHLLAGLIINAVGLDPTDVNYIAFSGGGEAVTALLGGSVTAGVSGYSEFVPHLRTGRLRGLAISSAARLPGVDLPTLREAGINVDLSNWRGIMAPPGVRPEDRERLHRTIELMTQSRSWKTALEERDWSDMYLDDAAYTQFLETEQLRVAALVRRLRGVQSAGSTAAEWLFPSIVGAAAMVLILLFLRARRSPASAPEPDMETIGVNRRAVTWVYGGLALYLALLYVAGFIIASTLLFASVAAGFGGQRWGRVVMVGVAFSTAMFVLFTNGLGLELPPGILTAWIR